MLTDLLLRVASNLLPCLQQRANCALRFASSLCRQVTTRFALLPFRCQQDDIHTRGEACTLRSCFLPYPRLYHIALPPFFSHPPCSYSRAFSASLSCQHCHTHNQETMSAFSGVDGLDGSPAPLSPLLPPETPPKQSSSSIFGSEDKSSIASAASDESEDIVPCELDKTLS